MGSGEKPDHRVLTGKRRREQTRKRLTESAVLVFAEKGFEGSAIEDVIASADVARGTFYNHFSSNHELLIAANEELGNELIDLIEQRVISIDDPALRLAAGIRIFIETTGKYPLLGKFVAHTGFQIVDEGNLIHQYIPKHVAEGIEQGRFLDIPLNVALDLISGTILFSVFQSATALQSPEHRANVIAAVMRGLGISTDEAWELANAPVGNVEFPDTSLLVRSHVRAHNSAGTTPTSSA